MDQLVITGGTPLAGAVPISGAKNSALPILGQQGRCEDGKGGILGAGNGHSPGQGDPAGDDELIHGGG